jgi:hypothetical protein
MVAATHYAVFGAFSSEWQVLSSSGTGERLFRLLVLRFLGLDLFQ